MKNKAGKALTLQELEQVAGGTAISRSEIEQIKQIVQGGGGLDANTRCNYRSEIQQIMQSLPDVNTDRNSRGQRTRLEGVPLDK